MVTGCVSDIDGCQRAGREVVNESTGFVYVRQAGRPPTHHHHWICPALSRYATVSPDYTHCASKKKRRPVTVNV